MALYCLFVLPVEVEGFGWHWVHGFFVQHILDSDTLITKLKISFNVNSLLYAIKLLIRKILKHMQILGYVWLPKSVKEKKIEKKNIR